MKSSYFEGEKNQCCEFARTPPICSAFEKCAENEMLDKSPCQNMFFKAS
jgi:hypothetical protein